MIISEEITKSVVFVGYQKANGTFVYCGTAFYYRDTDSNSDYLITARHLIDGISGLGLDKIYIRVNLKDGTSAHYSASVDEWFIHPTNSSIDVAIVKTGRLETFDHLALESSMCVNDVVITENEVSLGEEVCITGLFRHHHGVDRNIPIVRVGNLASMLVPKIMTEKYGAIEAYLVEARSIGGLSGSPVFLNLGTLRSIKGQMKIATNKPIHYLLGLVHGHFDVKATEIDDAVNDAGLTVDKVNTGIAIVVPCKNIQELVALHKSTNR